MKHFGMILMLLCMATASGQMQQLSALSSGRFLDSAPIMEADESDVFGYCLLYEKDRKSNEIFELEYVILDKNLNKLTSISLTQAVFKTWMARTQAELSFVKKTGNQLTIAVNDRLKNQTAVDLMPTFNYRFINVNLDDFTFTKEYKYEDYAKKENTYQSGDKMGFDDFWNLQKVSKTNSDYFISFATSEYNPKVAAITNFDNFDYKRHQSVKRFAMLDKDFNIVWSKDINADKKTATRYGYLDSDQEVLLLKKETLIKNGGLQARSIEVYNIKTGTLLGEITIADEKYDVNLYSTRIADGKIHVFTNAYEKAKTGRSLGYTNLVFDKQTLTQTSKNVILWKNLATVIPGTNEFGKVGKDDWLFAQDFVLTPKGNTLMIVEAFHTKSGVNALTNTERVFANLGDMHLIEFAPDNSVVFSKTIEKKNSVQIGSGLTAMQLKSYGVFDYIFCQKINKAGDFVLYYSINDQEGAAKKVSKKPLWTLGIVANATGQYTFETLPLYGTDVKIYPGLAKNGYIRLLEVNQKTGQAEMRLEKINY